MIVFLFWLCAALFVGFMGSGKTLGFWGSFIISLIFSPLIGIIVVLFSKSKTRSDEEDLLIKKQLEALNKPQETSTSDEIIKLKKLLDEGVITLEEFQEAKTKILDKM